MFQRLLHELAKWVLPAWSPTKQVVLLGVEHGPAQEDFQEAFLADFRSRLQFTYRKDLSTPLSLSGDRGITSDTGWGCMLRAMQMMLAQCFLMLQVGREWRYDKQRDLTPGSTYLQIVSCFLDVPTAPFSLHGFVAIGQRLLGKEPSAWFGPTSAAQAAGHLLKEAATQAAKTEQEGNAATLNAPAFLRGVASVVFDDGAIFKDSVLDCFNRDGVSSVIIFVCRRLGLEALNLDEYKAGIEACFRLPQFMGLASGNSGSSAHYFVGAHGDDCLLYLDPHTTQPSLETIADMAPGSALAEGLRPPRVLPLRWTRLNPSLCVGFLVKSSEEFLTLCDKLCEQPFSDVFEVLEQQPLYADWVVLR